VTYTCLGTTVAATATRVNLTVTAAGLVTCAGATA